METSASSKTMNKTKGSHIAKFREIKGIKNPKREQTMGTQMIADTTAGNSKQKFFKGSALCATLLALSFAAPQVNAATAGKSSDAREASAPSGEEQQGKQRAGDHVVVTLSDPSRPSLVKVF